MTRGLGLGTSGLDRLGLSDDEIVDLISTQVTSTIKEAIPELFDSIKTRLIDMFNNPYADVTNISVATTIIIVAAGVPQRGGQMHYWEFGKTKPLEFDGFKDPIVSTMWISELERCF